MRFASPGAVRFNRVGEVPRGSSLAPAQREVAVKKEEAHSPPCRRLYLGCRRAPILLPPSPQPEKKWWEAGLEMQAVYRGIDNTEGASGQHLLLNQSFNEDAPAGIKRQAEWWLANDSNNIGDHEPAPAPAPVIKTDDDDDFCSDDDDDDNSFLDYNASDTVIRLGSFSVFYAILNFIKCVMCNLSLN
jgi:hypothetical protein